MEVLLAILALAVLCLIDSFGSQQFGYGVVISKKFVRYRPLFGGSPRSTPRYIECYELRVRIANTVVDRLVSLETCKNIGEGDRVSVVYYQGRLSKRIIIKHIGESTMDFDFMQTIPRSKWF